LPTKNLLFTQFKYMHILLDNVCFEGAKLRKKTERTKNDL